MSYTKRHLEDIIENVIASQGIADTMENFDQVMTLCIEGIIEPLDIEGNYWLRDGKQYLASQKELIA